MPSGLSESESGSPHREPFSRSAGGFASVDDLPARHRIHLDGPDGTELSGADVQA